MKKNIFLLSVIVFTNFSCFGFEKNKTIKTFSNLSEVAQKGFHGLAVGIAGGTIIGSLTNVKNALQNNKPIHWNISFLSKGIVPFMIVSGFLLGIQNGGKESYLKFVSHLTEKKDQGLAQQFIGASFGGICSAPFGSAIEQLQILKDLDKSYMKNISTLNEKLNFCKKIITSGLSMVMLRNAGYGMGCLVGQQEMQKKLVKYNIIEWQAMLLSGFTIGLTTMLLTHPFDTIKTIMQYDIQKKAYPTWLHAARSQMNTYGFMSLFKGFLPRALVGVPSIMLAGPLLARLAEKKSLNK